jgi:predicted dehydrogenase
LGIIGMARILPAHLRGMKRLLDAGLADFRVTALVGRTMAGALCFRRRGEGPVPRVPVGPDGDPLSAPHMYCSDLHPDTLPECFTDISAMLEADRVDAVLLLTPVGLHHSQALQCMRAGVHVLCEKPLAVSVRAARAMVEEAERRGLTLGVAEGAVYDPTARLQRWAVDSGLLGPVEMLLTGGVGGFWSPDRICAETPWRHRKVEAGGGPAVDIGVHQFAHIRYVAGEVALVAAMTARLAPERFTRDAAGQVLQRVAPDVEDTYHALFRLAGGGTGQASFSWAGRGQATFWPGAPVVYGAHGVLRGPRFFGEDGVAADLAGRVPPELTARWFPGGIRDSKALQLLDFIRAAASVGGMEADGRRGMADLACAFAVLESAAARRTLAVEEVLAGSADAYQREIDQAYGLV